MKIFTKYILPAALVAGFLFYFFSDAFNRHFNLDDYFYEGQVRKFGIAGSIKAIYDLANGRWFGHIICALSFKYIGTSFTCYGVYLALLLALFLFGAGVLYKVYCASFLKKEISFFSATWFSLVFTAVLYFLQFEGRWEIWSWVSSANTHLMSVIVSFFLFSFLIKNEARASSGFWVFILAAFIGGLNEMNAICTVLTVIGLLLLNKKYFPNVKFNKTNLVVTIIAIISSLLINICSGGYKERMAGLPDFTVIQSLKNTLHSFLMHGFHYKFIPYFAVALIVFIFFIKDGKPNFSKKSLTIGLFSLAIVAIDFFLHCYTLSDVIPARGAVWGYCFLLFVFSLPFISEKTTE
jgi:hypothetical protein